MQNQASKEVQRNKMKKVKLETKKKERKIETKTIKSGDNNIKRKENGTFTCIYTHIYIP